MYRLRQINAEAQEDSGQLIAKVNIESIPATTTTASTKISTKPIDHNRLSTSQLYGKGCVILAEESSSRR